MDIFEGDGAYVRTIKFYDGNDTLVGEAQLSEIMYLGHGDKSQVTFKWEKADTYPGQGRMVVDMKVICPECKRNPLVNTQTDYVCGPCREILSDGTEA